MSDSEETINVSAPGGGNYGQPVGGNGNNGGQNGSGGNALSSDGKTLSVFGMPAIAVPVNGVWGSRCLIRQPSPVKSPLQ